MANNVDAEIVGDRRGQFVDIDFRILGHPMPPFSVPVKKSIHRAENETCVYSQTYLLVCQQGVDEGDGRKRFAQAHAMR